jgi:hypothetical protein
MRSKWSSVLVASVLASGGLPVVGVTSAWAQMTNGWPTAAGPGGPAAASNPGGPSPYAAGAPSPYAAGAPSPYAAGVTTPYAAGAASPYAARRGVPRDPATKPASATLPAPSTSAFPTPGLTAPGPANWAATAAAAPEKKPSRMRRLFSTLWRGGSGAEDEKLGHRYRDPSTGRTDLQGARPWQSPAP